MLNNVNIYVIVVNIVKRLRARKAVPKKAASHNGRESTNKKKPSFSPNSMIGRLAAVLIKRPFWERLFWDDARKTNAKQIQFWHHQNTIKPLLTLYNFILETKISLPGRNNGKILDNRAGGRGIAPCSS